MDISWDDITKTAAILGALAWVPHVYSKIKKWLNKPEVRVFTNKVAEISFTPFGPILNLRIAFSVKNKDIVLSDFKIKMVHEDGQEKTFECQVIRQEISTIRTPDGNIIPTEKEYTVLAIKLNQYAIEERFWECRDPVFIEKKLNYETQVTKEETYLKKQNKFDADEFLKSKIIQEYINCIRQSFSWKEGEYTITIELKSPEFANNFSLKDSSYKFSLSAVDIEELDKNKEKIEQYFEYIIKNDQSLKVIWNWQKPILSKV